MPLMSQSLSRILVHLVFSTKNRARVLKPRVRDALHPYLAGTLSKINCPTMEVGGTADHVHLLFGLSRTLSIADVVETVKTSSSKWIKTKPGGLADFHWQKGYGAFSVSDSEVDRVIDYILNQEQHHRGTTFKEEYRALLERHGVPYDERYVWD